MSKTIEAKMLRGRRFAAMAAGAVSLALASQPGAALAQDTQTVFEGFAMITAMTPQCTAVDFAAVNSIHVTVYRPHILSTDTDTRISINDLRSEVAFDNTSEVGTPQMNGSGSYFGAHLSSRVGFVTWSGTYSLTVLGAPITAATAALTITGTLNNVFALAGCSVTFQGEYVRRVF